jgi:predicted metal-dependent peptidase
MGNISDLSPLVGYRKTKKLIFDCITREIMGNISDLSPLVAYIEKKKREIIFDRIIYFTKGDNGKH